MYIRTEDNIYESAGTINPNNYPLEVKLHNGMTGYLDEDDVISIGSDIPELCDMFAVIEPIKYSYGKFYNIKLPPYKVIKTYNEYDKFIEEYARLKELNSSLHGYGFINNKDENKRIRVATLVGHTKGRIKANYLRMVLLMR